MPNSTIADKQKEMLSINIEQKRFYEDVVSYSTPPKKSNTFTLLWWRLRDLQYNYRSAIKVDKDILKFHLEWLGNLENSDVLDLGCYKGNVLSLTIAKNSKSYLGIDLSESGIKILFDNLVQNNITNAEAMACDFLSSEFQQKYANKFDVIYANGVAHHFQYFDVFLSNLHNILKDNGRVILLDPLQTPTIMKILRAIYRPFQSDKMWEWPFDKQNFEAIQTKFTIKKVQGVMGKAKWALFIYLVSERLGLKLGKKWHEYDLRNANKISNSLWSCMQVVMCIEKK